MLQGASTHRADGFYRFLTLIGLLTAISAAGFTVWNGHRIEERAFAMEASAADMSARIAAQQARVERLRSYHLRMTSKILTAPDVGSSHYRFMVAEADRANKGVVKYGALLQGLTAVAMTKSAQIGALNARRSTEVRLGALTAAAGIAIALVSLLVWFWRVQRYVEIETQARMTTFLIEEISARSRAEAARSRDSDGVSLTGEPARERRRRLETNGVSPEASVLFGA